MLCMLRMLCVPCMQVTEEALDVLLEYQQQMDRVRSDRKHKFALARTFVLPGRYDENQNLVRLPGRSPSVISDAGQQPAH